MGDVLVAQPEGGAVAPLVLFGDTSQDGSRYDSLPEPGGVTGNAFFFTQHGDDVIDASQAGLGIAAYGGSGDDLILGGSFGDHLAGGSGDDTIFGLAGNDHIYGDSGFNLAFEITSDEEDNAVLLVNELGRETSMEYDGADRLVAVVDRQRGARGLLWLHASLDTGAVPINGALRSNSGRAVAGYAVYWAARHKVIATAVGARFWTSKVDAVKRNVELCH